MEPTKVLVVEDNAQNLYLATYLLERAGFVVIPAGDGLEGIAAAREHQPDIVLMDILLPGVDGCEATRRLKADPATASIPVVALTAYSMSGDQHAAASAGCAAYITKPIDPATFADTVREIEQRSVADRTSQPGPSEPFEIPAQDSGPGCGESPDGPDSIGA